MTFVPTARLAYHVLRVGDAERSLAFYRERLGMTLAGWRERGSPDSGDAGYLLAFPGPAATLLELRQVQGEGLAYMPSRDDLYWKIGVTLADVDLARERLLAAGVAVSEARQFLDIGYLCHLADPDGLAIELLQYRFAANHRPVPPDPALPLGSRPTLGQITLRVADPVRSLAFYGELLGMTLLSRQVVAPRGFTLYFLAFTEERPPHADIDAVANREWLWQRPYTTLELQHVWGTEQGDFRYRLPDEGAPGFQGIGVELPDLDRLRVAGEGDRVRIEQPRRHDRALDADSLVLRDPDGTRVRVIERR